MSQKRRSGLVGRRLFKEISPKGVMSWNAKLWEREQQLSTLPLHIFGLILSSFHFLTLVLMAGVVAKDSGKERVRCWYCRLSSLLTGSEFCPSAGVWLKGTCLLGKVLGLANTLGDLPPPRGWQILLHQERHFFLLSLRWIILTKCPGYGFQMMRVAVRNVIYLLSHFLYFCLSC